MESQRNCSHLTFSEDQLVIVTSTETNSTGPLKLLTPDSQTRGRETQAGWTIGVGPWMWWGWGRGWPKNKAGPDPQLARRGFRPLSKAQALGSMEHVRLGDGFH